MSELINFGIEKSVVNSLSIFLTLLTLKFVAGPFLNKLGDKLFIKLSLYSLGGALGGLWSYSYFDIPERRIEFLEAITVLVAMFIYSFIVISIFHLFKNRKEADTTGSNKDEKEPVKINISSKWFILKMSMVVVLLVILGVFFESNFFQGGQVYPVDSQQDYKVKNEARLKLENIDLESYEKLKPETLATPPTTCRDDHLNYQFYSECQSVQKVGKPKGDKCQVILTVQNNNDGGKIFTNNQEIIAEFKMVGLTMVWEFEDGGDFQLEPNGSGVYSKTNLGNATYSAKQKFNCEN